MPSGGPLLSVIYGIVIFKKKEKNNQAASRMRLVGKESGLPRSK